MRIGDIGRGVVLGLNYLEVVSMPLVKKHRLDFDFLTGLAKSDPHQFELLRKATIEAFIADLPDERQARLLRLQWRIDQVRRTHSPMGACVKISSMMWDHLLGPRGLVGLLQGTDQLPVEKARIIPFPSEQAR